MQGGHMTESDLTPEKPIKLTLKAWSVCCLLEFLAGVVSGIGLAHIFFRG
jgi:hypothetical protein